MKDILARLLLSIFVATGLASCHEEPEYANDIYGNFDALWDIVDSRYCFFREKNIDWKKIGDNYRESITPETNSMELFFICAAMLDELKDGHVNLSSRYDTSYYREWWSDFPQDFNLRTLQQYYLEFDYLYTSGISYKQLPGKIAYMYYPSFSYSISESSLDYILAILQNSRGLIIDIRDNGGGALTNIKTLVSRFIDKTTRGGYIIHKTGPGHSDFSDPFPFDYEPAPDSRVKWNGPIVILTNRSCYSAANDFTAVMKSLPNVTVIGAKTGGGGGLPFSSELPIGWSVRFSACPLLDPDGQCTENGIDPSPGYEVHAPDSILANGKDPILERALDFLKD
ncbi:MAG: S41 family peptidase, partial [Muribaculaceae bacterium]|nr:S41 family peptidase [Muribaculaceae bacterium]